ncbi:MAG: hypothetical protein HY908_12495 [Myxococcales bacterium]|nr:hypothetical protein [Myxococcales bacterium]
MTAYGVRTALLLTVLVAASSPAYADGPGHAGDDAFHIGAGVGMALAAPITLTGHTPTLHPFGRVALYVPLDFAGTLRLEPSVEWTYLADFPDVDVSATLVGLGAFHLVELDPRVALSLGARGGCGLARAHPRGGADPTTRVDGFFSPTLGAEYDLSPWVSLAAELRAELYFVSEGDAAPHPVLPTPAVATSANTALFVRLFFL